MTEDEFAAYQSLSEQTEDHRWAFGTGFTDPLEGIDTSVPEGVNARALATYCLMLGDDALVYSHRLQQWMTRMPELEEETALANIALDLLGQARMLLARAGPGRCWPARFPLRVLACASSTAAAGASRPARRRRASGNRRPAPGHRHPRAPTCRSPRAGR